MRLRVERWGAWAMLESRPAIVALDHEGARALGVDSRSHEAPLPRPPLEAHVAVTERCGAKCEGCYVDAKADGAEPALASLVASLEALAKMGVFVVAFGGGEPTSRSDLGALAREAKSRGLFPVVTTSGLGLTNDDVTNLTEFSAVNVSYDGSGDDYAKVRGFEGARGAESAIARLAKEGVHVGVNVVLTRDTLVRIDETCERAVSLGAREIQLLRYKPAGRARSLRYFEKRLTPEQVESLGDRVESLVGRLAGQARVRIDCALVSLLSNHPAFADATRLARLGVFGCEGAGHLMALRADGALAPCSFANSLKTRVNDAIATTSPRDHADDAELARWRAWNDAPAEPCASCTLFSICKGGCKVVSDFVDREHGPDPECPRVRAHRERAS